MTQKELEQKVIDAEGRVAKREAVLKKHNSQLAKMIEKGADRFDISIKREDIKSATSKLAEAREILKNWQDKLNTRITRDAYLEANTPEILKDFHENWKQHAIGYYRDQRIRDLEYRKDLKTNERAARLEALQTLPSLEKYRELYKGRELTDYDLANLWPRRDVDAFLSERGLEYHQIQKKLREAGDQITLKLLEIHNEDEREAWLEKTMEEEKRAKLLDLIGRIMSSGGTITDAAALDIGSDGDIYGSIETISNGIKSKEYSGHFDGIIYGYRDSSAQSHAEAFGITFVALDGVDYDITGDGECNFADYVLLQKYLIRQENLSKGQLPSADISQDAAINGMDLALLRQWLFK